jgi:hypothetical protein
MFGKISMSVVLAVALFGASVRLPAASCILSNAPSDKACKPACCANKTCCETSHERTGPPQQPSAKSGFDQQNIAMPLSVVAVVLLNQTATDSFAFSSVECTPHSLAPIALICIRLI